MIAKVSKVALDSFFSVDFYKDIKFDKSFAVLNDHLSFMHTKFTPLMKYFDFI